MATRANVLVLCAWGVPKLLPILVCGLVSATALAGLAGDTIRNVTQGTPHEQLSDAIQAARDGDTIEISGGPHLGQFVVPRRLTLRGIGGTPVLDGAATGLRRIETCRRMVRGRRNHHATLPCEIGLIRGSNAHR